MFYVASSSSDCLCNEVPLPFVPAPPEWPSALKGQKAEGDGERWRHPAAVRSRKQSSGCLQGAPQAPERLCVIERSLRLYWTHPCPAASLFMAFYLLPQPDLTLASPPAG